MSPIINHAPLNRFSGQPDLIRTLIQMYLDIAPKMIEKIDVGVAGGDKEQVAFAAHSLKGSSAELGAEQMAELSQQIHTVAKDGDRETLVLLVKDLSRCYTETEAALEALDIS
jgi:HPt (histidine-containing phosphotransfer) domain-containing protein